MATIFAGGNVPNRADGVWVIEQKILGAITDLSGGGGGTVQVYTGASPPAAPDDPTKPALYYPTGGGTLFQWDGAAWV